MSTSAGGTQEMVPSGSNASRTLVVPLLAGLVAAVVGAVLWATVVALTHYEVGVVAIGVGMLVGLVVARTATAAHRLLPAAAALLGLGGCVLGDMLRDIVVQAIGEAVPVMEAMRIVVEHPSIAGEIFSSHFAVFDVVFWGLAAYAAYRFVAGRLARLAAAGPAVTAPAAASVVPGPVVSPQAEPQAPGPWSPTPEGAADEPPVPGQA